MVRAADGRKIFKFYDPIVYIIILAIVILPSIYRLLKFWKKESGHSSKVDYLLKNGKKLEINLLESLESIVEEKDVAEIKKDNTDNIFNNSKSLIESDSFTQEIKYISLVTLGFEVNAKKITHEIILRKSAEDIRKLFIFTKSTTLIYNPLNPEDCVVDVSYAD